MKIILEQDEVREILSDYITQKTRQSGICAEIAYITLPSDKDVEIGMTTESNFE